MIDLLDFMTNGIATTEVIMVPLMILGLIERGKMMKLVSINQSSDFKGFDINRLCKELTIFGSLNGMLNVEVVAPNKLTFCKKIFQNFTEYRHIAITVNCKESEKTGAISYSAKISYTDDRNIKLEIKTLKCYNLTTLRDDIIVAQTRIY